MTLLPFLLCAGEAVSAGSSEPEGNSVRHPRADHATATCSEPASPVRLRQTLCNGEAWSPTPTRHRPVEDNGRMHYQLLGSVEIHGPLCSVAAVGKDAVFLAELLVHADSVVTSAHLAQELWPRRSPRDPANAVQVRASRLRALLRSAGGAGQPKCCRPGTAGTGWIARVRRRMWGSTRTP